MLGCEMKHQAMGWVRQKGGASCHGMEHTTLALDAQIQRDAFVLGDQAHQGGGLMGVQAIHH